jgi:hypothetical protein
MARVYESALVTLDATTTPNAASGCFSTPDPKYSSRILTLTAREIGYEGAPIEEHAPTKLPREVDGGNPLFSGAWVK